MTVPTDESTSDESPNFEESLTELQQIVAALEDGSLGLEESLGRFERGISLLRDCRHVLDRAEQRIEILTGLDAEGNPVVEPFDASATFETAKESGRAGRRTRTAGTAKAKRASKRTAAEESSDDDDEASDDSEDDPARLF